MKHQYLAQPFGCPSGDLHFYLLRSEAKWVQQSHSSQKQPVQYDRIQYDV